MTAFVQPERRGTVMGNEVACGAIPARDVMAVEFASRAGRAEEAFDRMLAVVSRVHMADGSEIDVNALSVEAVTALFKFAAGAEDTAADFTSR